MAEWQGIDVSRYQGAIDWKRVKAAGKQFAFIRLGYCDNDGRIELDPTFKQNMKEAEAAGIAPGVYLYSYANTTEAAQRAAEDTISLIASERVTYPVVLDLEDALYRGLSNEENTAIAKAYLSEIEAQKYYAMLYTNTAFAREHLNMPELSRFDLWISDWRGSVGYPGSYGIWQYTNKGRVDGIGTDVDLDVSYRDYVRIIQNAGLNHLSEQPERWQILIYSFQDRNRALEVSDAFQILGLYSEVRAREDAWQIVMYSFREEARAREISKAITELGFYNEVQPFVV